MDQLKQSKEQLLSLFPDILEKTVDKTIAYLYPKYDAKDGSYSDLITNGSVSENFHWLNSKGNNWYIDSQDNPDYLSFLGILYPYGELGFRKNNLLGELQ